MGVVFSDRHSALRAVVPPWSKLDTALVIGITAAAGAIRLIRLGMPSEYLWDEFYAQDACFYLNGPAPVCGTAEEITWTHPPLGKWLIALGVNVFGYTPFGRRAAAMVAGTLAVALLYLLGRKLLSSRTAAAVAATLLAVDWLHFVQSRTAMLDIFVSTLGIAALLFLAFDRDRLMRSRFPETSTGAGTTGRRVWRYAAGAMAGAALAVKWSGGLILLLIAILTLAWEASARHPSGISRWWAACRQEWPSVAVAFLVVPAVVYVLSYAGNVHTTSYAGSVQGSVVAWPSSEDSWFKQFARRQVRMARFHSTLIGEHSYASAGWSWPLLKRPTVFFADVEGDRYREVLATGNPLTWWPAMGALLWTTLMWARRRRFSEPHGLIVMAFAVSYLPWIYLSRVRHLGFIYYMLPAVPAMYLALALVAAKLRATAGGKVVIGASVAAAVASFSFFYPVLAGVPIDRSRWDLYMLFRDCPGITQPGVHGSQPPAGWCWI